MLLKKSNQPMQHKAVETGELHTRKDILSVALQAETNVF
jgi:hypothetical protein